MKVILFLVKKTMILLINKIISKYFNKDKLIMKENKKEISSKMVNKIIIKMVFKEIIKEIFSLVKMIKVLIIINLKSNIISKNIK